LGNSTRFFTGYLGGHVFPYPAGEILEGMPSVSHPHWWLFVIPALGGLIAGIIVYTLAPEAEGHGTDSVIDAFHRLGGKIRKRVPLVKTRASVITIGSGGGQGERGVLHRLELALDLF
jgi:CIC family chloride channel protein